LLAAILIAALAAAVVLVTQRGGGTTPEPGFRDGAVRWTAVAGERSYRLALSSAPRGAPGRSTRYVTVPRAAGALQSYRPPLAPGERSWIGISADGGGTWSARELQVRARRRSLQGTTAAVELEQAAGPEPAQALAAPVPGRAIIGTDDATGWGSAAAATIRAAHIDWDRVEIGDAGSPLQASLGYGFKVLAIVGNVADSMPLSAVEPGPWSSQLVAQLRANPGMALAEAGNEMYFKGGVANPARYGRMYLAAVRAEHAAGLHVPLLFSTTGDYPHGTWAHPHGWSEDAAGGGWLREAVLANAGLAAAILANGLAVHPYGAPGESAHDDYGAGVPAALEGVARETLGAVPPLYVTEIGYSLSACGSGLGACSPADQAARLRAAYAAFLHDPHVAGIWWYQSHDDNTGRWGFMDAHNVARPALTALSEIAVSQGQ